MVSFLRVFKFAFQDIARNLGLFSMTIFILVLMLLSVNTLWSMDVVTKEAVQVVKQQVNISFYLVADASDQAIKDLTSYIQSFPQVVSVKVVSRNDVLASFETRHQFNTDVLQALSELGSNPFGPTIVVNTKEPSDYKTIMDAVNVPQYQSLVEDENFQGHEDALDRIQSITNRVNQIGLGLSILFAVIAFLIIFNAVRVAINSQRIEISIKRLVGASNWFIRAPYLVESLIYSVLSLAITMLIMYFAVHWLDQYLTIIFPTGFSLTNYYRSHMLYVFGIQGVVVLVLTVFSSTLAMRRQLKV